MERTEKIKKLENAGKVLKEEFVGLDSIIDNLLESISSWYITPEIIKRPVIISLWGMTGTGKSSVVRRLLELLEINNQAMFFDCGECTSENKNIADNICDSLGNERDEEGGSTKVSATSPIFIFDEFQYARTINDECCEEVKSSLRPIWSLLDSGIIDITDTYSWSFNQYCNFVEDFGALSEDYPEILIENNCINNPDDIKLVVDSLGLFYLGRNTLSSAEDNEDPYKPIKNFIDYDKLRIILRKSNEADPGSGVKVLNNIMHGTFKARELYEVLKDIKNKSRRTKTLDCSGALVFVIGNLDEAFRVEDDINPDLDADMFYDITSKVSLGDIKTALTKRFRAEQIARLGNNMIKYPTLKREHFQIIIQKETDRIMEDFKKVDPNLSVTVSPGMHDLLYSEGVFPVQGVRPIFTTIGTILTPYLSKILIEKAEEDKNVIIDLLDETDWTEKEFKIPETTIKISFPDSARTFTYKHLLQLGAARNPGERKKRYICSIHEAGHAVVYAMTTGKKPGNIVSVSIDHGGFCSTYDKEMEGEIDSRQDIDNDVMVSLGGYAAEHEFYNLSQCLLGSGSDLEAAWDSMSEAAYKLGYFDPVRFSNSESLAGPDVAPGMDHRKDVYYYNGQESIQQRMPIDDAIERRFNDLLGKTKQIIRDEKELIKEIALELGERGSMKTERFMEYVDKYGRKLTPESMEEIKKAQDPEFYKNMLV